MTFTREWRNFRRMEDISVAAAGLIYAGAVVDAFARLPGGAELVFQRTLVWPGVALALTVAVAFAVGALRRALMRYVWMSFEAGFGQTVGSTLGGVALLLGAAVFMYAQISGAANGGRYPAGVFAGYAAGIGVLFVQAVLVRRVERLPEVLPRITEP